MKKLSFKKVLSSRNTYFLLFILTAVFLFGKPVFASVGDAIANVIGYIMAIAVRAISSILILIVGVLMDVAAYSDFINAPAVAKGWIVVRDLCNMFFVVILLIIAFATILGQEEYGAKKMLPKLVMAAVLINFSKLLCGLMIDLSNVIMLTFVNAFSAIGAGNILDMLGIADVTKMAVSSDSGAAITIGTVVTAYIFGLIYVVIATVVVAAMLGMLVVRVVMIWILTVLSPLAFFLQAVPGKGASYAGQWWNKWTNNLLVGPIIAFFLWLSFAALQNSTSPISASSNSDLSNNNSSMEDASGIGTKAGTPSAMAKFVIAIGMLIGGMTIAKEVGGEAGSTMGKIFGKGKGLATAAGIGALAIGGKAVGRGALLGTGKLINTIPSKTTDANGNVVRRKGNVVGDFALGWQADLVASNKKAKKAAAAKYLGKLGIGEKGSEAGQKMINTPGFQKISTAIKSGAIGFAAGGPVAASVASVAGFVASSKREKAKKDIKAYENASGKASKANQDLAEYDGHKGVVDDFEQKRTRASDLLASKWRNGGRFASQADEEEYRRTNAFVTDTNNVNKYNASSNYLANNNRADKEAALNEANNAAAAAKSQYDSGKKWEKRTSSLEAFENTKAAMADQTKKAKAAQDWVNVAANDTELLQNIGDKGNIYSSAGASETWKKRLDVLNGGGDKANQAISNMVAEIDTDKVGDGKMKELAKLLAAYKKGGGTIETATLGRLQSSLVSKGHNPDLYDGKVSTQYKQLGTSVEDVKDGSGALQYDAFAKNSIKSPADRNAAKDIMGVSFDKVNEKAKSLGVDYQVDSAAGVNQKVDGDKLGKLSQVMSGLIDDEISGLQKVGGEASAQKISQLNAAKSRLASGDISGMSLKNTDVVYKGETDSERRRNEYNTTQHENLHQYGAQNEEVVDKAAGALQEAKLVGRIPQSDAESGGKRYDEVLGSMIAKMEQSGNNSEVISDAIADQIRKWQVPNAKRVIETEEGVRDSVKDSVADTEEKPAADADKVAEAIKKLSESLDKPLKSSTKNKDEEQNLSMDSKNFFRLMFRRFNETVSKGDVSINKTIEGNLKPLSAMAVGEENKSKA
jgi:hypothetical protein